MRHGRPDYEGRFVDTGARGAPDHKIPEDEPVLLIRGQDLAAFATARAWADENDRIGGDPEMSRLVREHAARILDWQQQIGGGKLADMPTPPPGVPDVESLTREILVDLCARAVVPIGRWSNRDSADAQQQVARAGWLLAAGAEFNILTVGSLATSEKTIWVEIDWPGFNAVEYGYENRANWESENFYLPTAARLDRAAGGDWY